MWDLQQFMDGLCKIKIPSLFIVCKKPIQNLAVYLSKSARRNVCVCTYAPIFVPLCLAFPSMMMGMTSAKNRFGAVPSLEPLLCSCEKLFYTSAVLQGKNPRTGSFYFRQSGMDQHQHAPIRLLYVYVLALIEYRFWCVVCITFASV